MVRTSKPKSDVTDVPTDVTDVPTEETTVITPRQYLSETLGWLNLPGSDKGWQALCAAKPTPAQAVSYLAREGLTSKSRPGEGLLSAEDDHPASIIATYPNGRKVVSRTDDGCHLLGISRWHALAVMPLQLASMTKIVEAVDPLEKATEIHGSADKRAAEEAAKKRASMITRAERNLRDAYALGEFELINAAEAFARGLGINPADVEA